MTRNDSTRKRPRPVSFCDGPRCPGLDPNEVHTPETCLHRPIEPTTTEALDVARQAYGLSDSADMHEMFARFKRGEVPLRAKEWREIVEGAILAIHIVHPFAEDEHRDLLAILVTTLEYVEADLCGQGIAPSVPENAATQLSDRLRRLIR